MVMFLFVVYCDSTLKYVVYYRLSYDFLALVDYFCTWLIGEVTDNVTSDLKS